jgi:DNA-binding NarL/FixJ family response regulator
MIAATPLKPAVKTKRPSGRRRGQKVVIIDDHPMIREHLGHMLVKKLGVIVCGQGSSVQEGSKVILETQPDLAIIDMKLRGSCGLELVKEIVARRLNTRVLVLSMHDEEIYAERAFKAGANGYITKENVSSTIVGAIQQVMEGKIYASDVVTAKLFNKVERLAKTEMDVLTDREFEVFQLLGRGKNTREIAGALSLGNSTVETYRCRIKGKLGIRSAAELYQRAGLWVRENGG